MMMNSLKPLDQIESFKKRLSSQVLAKLNQLINSQEYDEDLAQLFSLLKDNESARNYLLNNVLNDDSISFNMKSLAEFKRILLKAYEDLESIFDLKVTSGSIDTTAVRGYVSDAAIPKNNKIPMLDGLLEKQEKIFEDIITEGTLHYIIRNMLDSLKGNVNAGNTTVEAHVIRNALSKIFLNITYLISLTKRVDPNEYSNLINEVNAFINKYVKEISAHLLEAGTSDQLDSVFNGSAQKFTDAFNVVMNEEASRTYREIGVNVPNLT